MIENAILPMTPVQKRLIIVGEMRSLYSLAQTARRGDTLIEVGGSNAFLGEMSLGKGSTRETILHEVGQAPLRLVDIVDPTDFMHFDTGTTGYRLRYCSKKVVTIPRARTSWKQLLVPL